MVYFEGWLQSHKHLQGRPRHQPVWITHACILGQEEQYTNGRNKDALGGI